MDELKRRSILKSICWRLLGVLILGTITYLYTKKWITTGLITVIHHGVFLFVFYFHERIWLKVKEMNPLKRSILKCITYETLCGFCILGTITLIITGSFKQMTAITFSYIFIKHVLYVINERLIWEKIRWGQVAVIIFLAVGIANAEMPGTLSYKTCLLVDSVSEKNDDFHLQTIFQWDYVFKIGTKLSIVHLTEFGVDDRWVYEHVTKIMLEEDGYFCVLYRKHYPNKISSIFRHYVGIGYKIKLW